MGQCIFGNKNQHKLSKTTQNYCIIYARSPEQLEQYSKNLEIKIKIENVCWKINDRVREP